MATPREIFEKDSGKHLRVHKVYTLNTPDKAPIEIIATLSFDFDAGVKYASIYFDKTERAEKIILDFIGKISEIHDIDKSVEVASVFLGTDESIRSLDLMISPRLLVYTPTHISSSTVRQLIEYAKGCSVDLLIREGSYIERRIVTEMPIAFISHDSADKDELVRPLANKLHSMLCTVWYDEFSLIPGQGLRESIEAGLKRCQKCILVLSPKFLSNEGWTKAEFDTIYTREIVEKKKVVIPIWHGVTRDQIYEYCPRLVDRVGIPSSLHIDEVAKRVMRGINYEP